VRVSIIEAVAAAVVDNDCLVALGGGADSAVLVWAAVETLGAQRVRTVFVYHGLEGSDALLSAAVAVSEAVGVQCDVLERLVPEGGNLEARSRTERYDAIEAIVAGETIALTGHTADDQAETVLMRLLRGSGTGAVSGIPYRRGVWRRPLLGVPRATLREIAEDLGLPFVDDPANTDRRFLRARIRHSVMPVIEAECGPDAKELILRSAALLAADDEALEAEAANVPILPVIGGVSIPLGPLMSLPDPIASRVARRALRRVLDDYPGSAADVDAVLSVARGGVPRTISGSFQVVREPPFVTIHDSVPLPIPDAFEVFLGDSFTWFGSRYATRVVGRPPPSIAGGRITILDAQVVGESFHVRRLRPGDRIDIGTGSTPAKEVLRSSGVPARVRPYSLVVTVGDKIAALVGVRVASWAKPVHGERVAIIEQEVNTWK
jgi:tRNA(Ile)-lysidine synthase